MECQTFDIENCMVRNILTLREISAKLEVNFTMWYHKCTVLKLVQAQPWTPPHPLLPPAPSEFIKSYLET